MTKGGQKRIEKESNRPQVEIVEALRLLKAFRGADLTDTISQIEESLRGVTAGNFAAVVNRCGAKAEVLSAAGIIKRLSGQINVVIHALGILLCLPHILRLNEVIDYVSLGAGKHWTGFRFGDKSARGRIQIHTLARRTRIGAPLFDL